MSRVWGCRPTHTLIALEWNVCVDVVYVFMYCVGVASIIYLGTELVIIKIWLGSIKGFGYNLGEFSC